MTRYINISERRMFVGLTAAYVAGVLAVTFFDRLDLYRRLFGGSTQDVTSSCKHENTKEETDIREGIEGCVGNTPLVKIKSLSEVTGCEVLAKAEVRLVHEYIYDSTLTCNSSSMAPEGVPRTVLR